MVEKSGLRIRLHLWINCGGPKLFTRTAARSDFFAFIISITTGRLVRYQRTCRDFHVTAASCPIEGMRLTNRRVGFGLVAAVDRNPWKE